MSPETQGRRERKNAQTRWSLAEAALQLFLDQGYDRVSVKQIADTVDISVPTVFKHVPEGKVALIFDDGSERREGLLNAVRERRENQSVMQALKEFMAGRGPFAHDPNPEFARFTDLVMRTPELADYQRKLWIRCEDPLAEAIAVELGREPHDITARAAARYVLEVPQFIGREENPRSALDAVFDLLEHGLPEPVGHHAASS